ncbi:MAG TPA: hypothetical protein VFE31_03100 [Opitutaceae bacterium]|jgi:hypothetical protein|nr:hypothetical protein [Opitutaceae bacterium]
MTGKGFGVPLAAALASPLPFLLFYRQFARLFWFGDEFPLLDEIDTRPFIHWLWQPFVENILPFFKLIWGGLLLQGCGSYLTMLELGWLIHAVNVALLATAMRRSGFQVLAVAFCATIFAWSATQIETVTWSVQISSELATMFFLLAWVALPSPGREFSLGRCLALLLFSLGSAWSFSRGLLTGPVAAVTLWTQGLGASPRSRVLASALALAPAVATSWLMMRLAPADAAHLGALRHHLGEAAAFALCYLGANPAVPWYFSSGQGNIFAISAAIPLAAGAIKLGILAAGWKLARPEQRRFLLPILLLDFGYALLLGLGRWNDRWPYAMSSRYQYTSLLCSLPFAAIVIERGAALLWHSSRAPAVALASLTVLAASFNLWAWSRVLPAWTDWRGRANRQLLLHDHPVPLGAQVQGVPGFPDRRAEQLTLRFRLR